MATLSVSAVPETKVGGLALMAGMVLSFTASMFTPGVAVINPVDRGDFPAAIAAQVDSSTIAHLTGLIMITAMLLSAYGALVLFRFLSSGARLADTALRFGLGVSLFSWGVNTLSMGLRLTMLHVTQHGVGAGAGPEVMADLEVLALTIYTMMAGLHTAFLAVFPFAAVLLGLGLAPRFQVVDVFRIAAYGMVVIGLVALTSLVFAQHLQNLRVDLFVSVSNSLLGLGSLWLFIIGIAMYQGRGELVRADSPG